MMIRTATTKDLSGIAELEQEWLSGVPTWGYRSRSESELRELPGSNTLVAIEEEKIIAFAVCAPRTNDGSCIYIQGDRIMEVLDLFVTRNWRGKGVGQALLTAIEVRAKKDQYTKLIVYSSVRDIDGVLAFYRASGFTSWSIQLFKELGPDVLSE